MNLAKTRCTNVDEGQVPSPQRPPSVIAALREGLSVENEGPTSRHLLDSYSIVRHPISNSSKVLFEQACVGHPRERKIAPYLDIPKDLVTSWIRMERSGPLVFDILQPKRVVGTSNPCTQRIAARWPKCWGDSSQAERNPHYQDIEKRVWRTHGGGALMKEPWTRFIYIALLRSCLSATTHDEPNKRAHMGKFSNTSRTWKVFFVLISTSAVAEDKGRDIGHE